MSGTRKPPGRPIGDTGDLRARNEELERLLASEREHADAISRQSHELVRKAFQASPVAISVTRMSDGRVIEVNEWFERLLGYTRDEVVGKTTIEIGIWADEGARAGFLKDIAVTGSLANRMCLFHTKNGESVETRFSSETIELDGESCLLSVFVDVTESRKAEKTLVESERKYREIFELMPVSIWEYDISGAMPLLKSLRESDIPDYGVWLDEHPDLVGELHSHVRAVDVNTETMRLYGARSKNELLWGPGNQHTPEEVRIFREAVAAFLGGEDRYQTEMINITPDGRRIDIILRMHLPEGLESSGRMLAAVMDITERRRTEEALRISESNLSRAQAVAHVGSWHYDNLADVLTWTDETYRIFDVPIGESLARDAFMACVHPDDREAVDKAWFDALKGARYDIEHRIVMGSEIKWVREQAEFTHDASGKITSTIGTVQDITARKRAEEALKLSEERFSKAFRASPVAISLTRARDGCVLEHNEAMGTLLGFTRDDTAGKTTSELEIWAQPADRDILLAELAEKGAVRDREYRFRKKDGDIVDVRYSAEVIEYDNEPCVLSVLVDISARRRAEELLRESEEKLKSVMQGAPIPQFFIDKNHTVVYWNKAIEEYSGIRAGDIVGTKDQWKAFYTSERPCLTDLLVDGNIEKIREWYGGKYRKSKLIADAYEAVDFFPELGEEGMWLYFTASLIRDSNDAVVGALETLEDITERKQAEEQLRASEERYRHIFNNVPVAIWEYDFSDTIRALDEMKIYDGGGFRAFLEKNPDVFHELLGTVHLRDVNDQAVVMYGALSKDTLLCLYGSYPPETLDGWREAMIAYLEGRTDVVTETMNRTFDGRRIHVSIHTAFTEEVKRTGRALVTALDITDRKQAEEALRESEVKYRTLAENTSDILYQLDLEGNLMYLGPQVARYGYEPALLVGRNMVEFIHPEDRDRMAGEFARAITTGEEFLSRFRIADARGRIIWIEESGKHLVDTEGSTIGFTGVLRDITERKRLEEQLQQSQKMESVGRLAGGVAHDFNNILTAIIGNTDLLLMTLSPRDPSYAEIAEIRSSAERAANLTRQLLAFSRKQIISPRIVNFNDVIADMEKMLRRLIGEHISFLTLPDPALRTVNVDIGQMEQVLTNLVVNARDAMQRGGKLTIETANASFGEEYVINHPEMIAGEYVMLAVSDTGIGMSREVQSHLFEPFFTTKPKGSGTGLGLSTCYGIVKQNHGFIWVYSESNVGTTVKVYLPVSGDSAGKNENGRDAVPSGRGTETVLVVEDDAAVLSMIVRMLKGKGYTVLTAGDGIHALEVMNARSGKVDILVTDVVMPNMDGKTLSDMIRTHFPGVMMLFMSGYTDDAIVHHGVLDPGLEFIQKPFSVEALARKVRELLDREKN